MIMDVIIENLVQIAATLLITLIGVLGTWLTAKLGKKTELSAIHAAQGEVITLAQQTVEELQQTVVEELKAAHKDHKLTKDEIKALGKQLIDQTIRKMSDPSAQLLSAAGVDIRALIKGAGEEWIRKINAD